MDGKKSLRSLALLVCTGCAAQQPIDTFPDALAEAARAMRERDATALHAMLDEKLTVGIAVEDLGKDLDANKLEYEALAKDLATPASVAFTVTAETGSGTTLEFVLEQETWKLSTPIVGPQEATDPILALQILAKEMHALSSHIGESGVLAAHHSQGLLLLLDKIATELKAVKAEDLVLADDRCWCTLTTGHKFELVREGQQWKVFSVFPPIEFR